MKNLILTTILSVGAVYQATADDLAPLPLVLPPPAMKGTPQALPTNTTALPLDDKPRPAFMAPKGCANVALNKPVTASHPNLIAGELKQITDGKKQAYEENVVTLRKGVTWVQIDLQAEFHAYAIMLWHDFTTPIVCRDVIVQLSDDPNFVNGVTTLFNNDSKNAAGLGIGTDREYFENSLTGAGKLIDAKGTKARYVRCYSKGSTDNALNTYIEVEAWGLPGFMNRRVVAALVLLAVVGLGLRLPKLALRPMHNDEGVNAMKFRALWVNNNYKYDPNEFHGPTLPYFTLPSALLNGARDFNQFGEATYRAVPALFGVGLILLMLLLPDFGKTETLWAAALITISPAMVFYSRYYIHEMLLVFFTALTFFASWRYAGTGKLSWAMTAGVGLGLMAATKETFVFAVAASVLAVASSAIWTRLRGANTQESPLQWRGKSSHVIFALLTALAVVAIFFSSFFTNAAGLSDAVRTYIPWIRRAGGQTIHAHSWAFYFHRLIWFRNAGGPVWTELFVVVLATIGFFFALFGPPRLFPRLLAFYTFWLTLIYTGLAYKTPWCLLGFYHGAILLAGIGAASILRAAKSLPIKAVVAIALLIGTAQLAWQTYRENFGADHAGVAYCSSPKNPYVYSQTSPDVLQLVNTIEAIAQVSTNGYNTDIEVMAPQSYWPLPWYLRRFTRAGYWDEIPKQPLAPIMIVSTDLHAAFDERPGKTHLMAGFYQLRPNVFMELYVAVPLWSAYVKTLPPEKD